MTVGVGVIEARFLNVGQGRDVKEWWGYLCPPVMRLFVQYLL
ncbi:MAG: hypothetical protein ACXV5H_07885 [Halobacteriota archaeon]